MKCIEKVGNAVDAAIVKFFLSLGRHVGNYPRRAIVVSIVITLICAGGFAQLETETRGEKLFVPQDTRAQEETIMFESYFPSLSRVEQILVQPSNSGDETVLTKERLAEAMQMHMAIETGISRTDGQEYTLETLCTVGGNACANSSATSEICKCRITSILGQWNYNPQELEDDNDILTTITQFGSQDDLNSILSGAVFDESSGQVLSAKAFSMTYFLDDRSFVEDGEEKDPISEAWEKDVFLDTVEPFKENYPSLFLNWLSERSFEDDGGSAVQGDLELVQYSYIAVFLFLGATLGNFRCGLGSRWTMAIAAIMLVGFSTVAGIGLSAFFQLIYSPVHSLLPFVLLGIGVDDAFVICNAFDQERKGQPRTRETNEQLLLRSSRALSRAGASITVTSFTDLVAFAISSSSGLPALASFSAYAAISVFFLWLFSAIFFTACLVFDERRQIENRRECFCCLTRKKNKDEEEEERQTEDVPEGSFMMTYFRNVHGKAILWGPGKVMVLLLFGFLLVFGAYSATLLEVEDTQREFIPTGTSLSDYFDASDELFPDAGIDFFFVFEGASNIYQSRNELARLDERVSGLSNKPPYIAEPNSEEVFRNVMAGFHDYLIENGSGAIGNVTLDEESWPTNEQDFVNSLQAYTQTETAPGSRFRRDCSFSFSELEAINVASEYVRLTKESNGRTIDDADKQIDAMDLTRDLVQSWTDLQSAFVYSDQYVTIEGFKVISQEFFRNIFMAIGAVAVIVLITVASPLAAALITFCVVGCIVEILGFMYHLGIVIDSVSAVMLVLAVGLSVDYSAHIGHNFMTKPGDDRDERVMQTLSDVGAAVMNGAITTFLAVAILLMSESYVFWVLSRMFLLTVLFGVANGLLLLPVLLSMIGPKAFEHHKELPNEDLADESVREGDEETEIPADEIMKGKEELEGDKN
eukprot:CAMPEP_0168780548 /NCGR_PEP_ID=MMETSP0725-20121227/8174_1 /TAXON_ID=265536 /ORGANISM="Amphiprora sp., Strain CCMP467" /LENGTH=926 /DNA_ID=CAMNT_0008830391 /DNA_START=34 /DNA_END=2814 /DNA_ORIENTATION=-